MADREPQIIRTEPSLPSAEGSVTTSSVELKIDALTQSVGRLVQCLSSEAVLSQREEDLLLASEEDYDPTCSLTGDDVEVAGQPEKDTIPLPDSDLFNDPDQCGEEISKELANRVDLACTKKPAKDKLGKIQERYLRPKSCTMLVAPRVNPELCTLKTSGLKIPGHLKMTQFGSELLLLTRLWVTFQLILEQNV